MKKSDFIELARSSTDELKSFASFVRLAEEYCTHHSPFLSNVDLDRCGKVWFTMEIVNANALSEWEDDGRPVQWSERWIAEFQDDAIDLVGNLIDLLEGRNQVD
ncbi:hypothetical protein [Paludibacterium paludis]|uniref:hypothetical protein n=1 Tax=Paludibacterium paludis TaxID=1225769 RepID=UPI0016757442|nr:hypothetical protein [Paludibacterium paludis]